MVLKSMGRQLAPEGEPVNRIRGAKVAYGWLAWGVVAALLIQVSLIGVWMFANQPTLWLHREFGHGITLAVLALLTLAFVGKLSRSTRVTTALLFAVLLVQTEVFAFIPGSPMRAFHTVLPLVIFTLAAVLAYAAKPLVMNRPLRIEVRADGTPAHAGTND